jgi:hypothetical protein
MLRKNCIACLSGNLKTIFSIKILSKYDGELLECESCKSYFFKEPFWLEEAHKNAISNLDVGIVERNLIFKNLMMAALPGSNKKYMDYGAGTGLLVRMLRDRGLEFEYQDQFAQPTFPVNFSHDNSTISSKYNAITIFEVFEHLHDPRNVLVQLGALTDLLIFSTELSSEENMSPDYWYLQPLSGQHINFVTHDGLERLGKTMNYNLYSNNKNLHCYYRGKLSKRVKLAISFPKVAWVLGLLLDLKLRKKSLVERDYLSQISKRDMK